MKKTLFVFLLLIIQTIYAQTTTVTRPKKQGSGSANVTQQTKNNKKPLNVAENGKLIETTQKVNLGLPSGTIWAGWNVGANKPEQSGDYYAWGETSSKSSYNMNNYFDVLTYNVGEYGTINATFKNYNGQNSACSIVGTDRDVVKKLWGNGWQMPTSKQIEELINCCTFVYSKYHKIYGFVCTGPNGKSIFLPASGIYKNTNLEDNNLIASLWSGTLSSSDPRCSIVFYCTKVMNRPNWIPIYRYQGCNIRGVAVN